jgi:hypothetical protein
MDIGYKRDARRHQAATLAIPLLGEEDETQMRRMLKPKYAVGDAGGPLSELHAAVESGATNLTVAFSRTMVPLPTTVT